MERVMGTVNPRVVGLVLGALGAAFHLVRIVLVVMGRAQSHTIGSLNFPETAAIIVVGTVVGCFIVGVAGGLAWNQLAKLPWNKRLSWATAVVLAVLAIGYAFWIARLSPVEVQVALGERDVAVKVFGLGTVEAKVTSKVGFKVPGVLVDLRADVGDRIANGAVLARLDDREQRARVARAEAALEQARASQQKAKASLDKAQANFANAKSISERRQKLVQTNITSVETAESAKAAQDAAGADIALANSDIAVAEAAISDAKAQQQQERATLDFHTLTAPYDAMITARLKELGSALAAGEPVFSLIDPRSVWVLAYIDESKAGDIKVGEPAEIVLRSRPRERLSGRVVRIEPESDRVNEERRVEIAFDRIPDNPALGEQAEVYITTLHLPQAVLVPEAAIVGLGKDSGTVWTVEDGHLQQRVVTLGHRLLDGRYEITGGLPDRAAVVTQLRSGLSLDRVAVVSKGARQ
jgi:HlyD family secretion protein